MAQEEFLDAPLPDIVEQWRYYLRLLAPAPGDSIIDVGCNTGDVERFLLREYPHIGRVVGIEANQRRYERAVEKWRQEGAPSQIEFKRADGRHLPLADNSFDSAICAETLEYIEPPQAALGEIHRVLKPGGAALIVHTDFEAQVFNTHDKRLSRKIITAFAEAGPNGYIGRELFGLCRQIGFQEVELAVYPLTSTEWLPDRYGYRMANMMADWLNSQALIDSAEIDQWLSDLEDRADAGEFFYSVNRYICRCTK